MNLIYSLGNDIDTAWGSTDDKSGLKKEARKSPKEN
jgi:hypothetical protein